MSLPSSAPDIGHELEVLRQRAYGPNADISSDPAGVARLDQLERAAREVVMSRRAEAETTPPIDGAEVPVPSTRASAQANSATPASEPAGVAWWRRRTTWLAAATIVVSAAVAGAIAFSAQGPRPDTTLPSTSEAPSETLMTNVSWLISSYGVEPASMTSHDEFAALSVWTARTDRGLYCLFLTVGDAYVLERTCRPPGLDPVIDLAIAPGTTDFIAGGAYPEGTALRFRAHDDTVDVWVETPPFR